MSQDRCAEIAKRRNITFAEAIEDPYRPKPATVNTLMARVAALARSELAAVAEGPRPALPSDVSWAIERAWDQFLLSDFGWNCKARDGTPEPFPLNAFSSEKVFGRCFREAFAPSWSAPPSDPKQWLPFAANVCDAPNEVDE